MRILVGHCRYRRPGGEDRVFSAEAALLETRAHRVCRYVLSNKQLDRTGSLRAAARAVWNSGAYRSLRRLIRETQSRVAHFHNTFAAMSPAVYYAARAERAAVVQTLHNYRLVCPNAIFFRERRICQECAGRRAPWPAVLHACYRGSPAASAAAAGLLAAHRLLGTWAGAVDLYIALTDFARNKLIEGGLPPDKIVVKPNFVDPDPGLAEAPGRHALFLGRLVPEKGVLTLLAAWERLGKSCTLRIAGEGPLAPKIAEAARRAGNIEYLGWQSGDRALSMLREARVLVFPSEWYEGFPMVVAEAFAAGVPVIASDLGSMSALVDHGRTGLHFRAGDAEDLGAKLDWVYSHPAETANMRWEARREYEKRYTAERNYELLMEIYERATRNSKSV